MNDVEPGGEAPVRPSIPWQAREAVLIWLVAFVLTIIPAAFITDADALTVAALVVNELALLGVLLVWLRVRYGLGLRALGFRPVRREDIREGLAVGLRGLIAAYAVTTLILLIANAIAGRELTPPDQIDLGSGVANTGLIVVLGITVVLIAPVAEEALFRGFVYPGLRRWATPAAAVGISSVAFGLVHLFPLVIVATSILGILLARSVERTRTVVPAVIAHMLFNAVGFGFLLSSL